MTPNAALRRLQEIVVAPEMLVWYLLVAAGIATIWRERRRWSYVAPLVLALGALWMAFGRSRRQPAAPALSAEEEARLAAIRDGD